MEGGETVSVCDAWVGTVFNEVFHNKVVAVSRGNMERRVLEVLSLLVHILTLSD